MSRIKKKSSKGQPGISTASLPDIVFMLLFFFMAVAVLKSVDPKVEYKKPEAQTLTRFENASVMANIRVGNVPGKKNVFRIQLDDQVVANESYIVQFIETFISGMTDIQRKAVIAGLEIDENAKMSLINKIKGQLQDAKQYKVAYLADELLSAN